MELVKTNKYEVICENGVGYPLIGHQFEASVLHFTGVSPDWMQVSLFNDGVTCIKFRDPVQVEIATEFGSEHYKAFGDFSIKAFLRPCKEAK